MKKNFFFMAALLVAMTGCNKEPQMENNGISSDDKVYMSFSIQTLTTRSATDTEGETNSNATPDYEVGLDKENTISSVDVVLRNANSYVCATVTSPTQAQDGNTQTWVAEFNSTMLATDTDYEVYIYANCSAKQDVHATSDASIDDMTQANKFWMTNAYEPVIVNFKSYSTDQAKPTDLGTHYVERAMARFDYMPKGPYTLQEKDGQPTVQVNLTEAALINQSKEFYMLRRVSADGTNKDWVVGGVETPNNYVVDTDYEEKSDRWGVTDIWLFDQHMTRTEEWIWKSILTKDLTQTDNWEGTAGGTTDYDGTHNLNEYYIWQYCKENTIPKIEMQLNGFSTGIVFKGKLSGDLVTAAAGKPIYVFDNILYGTWDKVVAAAAEDNASEAFKFAVSVCNDDKGEAKDAATLAAAGFTGFSADDDGNYYTYYYYWNRHNDNGKNQDMGKMEFAVVRNNVYKICVDNIAKYGHPKPGGSDPDPDPVDPKDPDEKAEYYFSVTAKVLPWVVRVNHVEF